MSNKPKSPKELKPAEMYVPVLQALIALGGTAYKDDVITKVGETLPRSADFPTVEGRIGSSRFRSRIGSARSHLSQMGYMRFTTTGVWSITELGRSHANMSVEEATVLYDNARLRIRKKRSAASKSDDDEE